MSPSLSSKCRILFIRLVSSDPKPLTDLLEEKGVITVDEAQKVREITTNTDAARRLYESLITKKNWFKYLVEALKNDYVGLGFLAETLQQIEQGFMVDKGTDPVDLPDLQQGKDICSSCKGICGDGIKYDREYDNYTDCRSHEVAKNDDVPDGVDVSNLQEIYQDCRSDEPVGDDDVFEDFDENTNRGDYELLEHGKDHQLYEQLEIKKRTPKVRISSEFTHNHQKNMRRSQNAQGFKRSHPHQSQGMRQSRYNPDVQFIKSPADSCCIIAAANIRGRDISREGSRRKSSHEQRQTGPNHVEGHDDLKDLPGWIPSHFVKMAKYQLRQELSGSYFIYDSRATGITIRVRRNNFPDLKLPVLEDNDGSCGRSYSLSLQTPASSLQKYPFSTICEVLMYYINNGVRDENLDYFRLSAIKLLIRY